MRNYGYLVVMMLLSACSSLPSRVDIAKENAEAAEVMAEAQEAAMERSQDLKENAIDEVPEWVLYETSADSTGFYALGTGQSQSLNMAIQKAVLEAEYGLAKKYRQTISGSERRLTEDNLGDVDRDRYIQLIDKLVGSVSLVGYETVRREVKAVNGEYVAYVLVKLPYDKFNQVLKDQRAGMDDLSMRNAFDELERRTSKLTEPHGLQD